MCLIVGRDRGSRLSYAESVRTVFTKLTPDGEKMTAEETAWPQTQLPGGVPRKFAIFWIWIFCVTRITSQPQLPWILFKNLRPTYIIYFEAGRKIGLCWLGPNSPRRPLTPAAGESSFSSWPSCLLLLTLLPGLCPASTWPLTGL